MTRILEKYNAIFPPNLFLCSDDEHSMHFIFSIKHLSDSQQEELVELLNHCGANVSFSVGDATNHSAVIVDHDEVVSVKIPAFTLNYIEECLNKLKVQNISNYRQDATSHIASNVQCMDVVYYRIRSWDSVLTKEEKQWLNETVDSGRSLEPQAASSCIGVSSFVDRRIGSCEQKDDSKNEGENPKTVKEQIIVLPSNSQSDSAVEQNDNQVHMDKTHDTVKNTNIKMKKSRNPKATQESTNSQSKALNSKSNNGTAGYSGNNQNPISGSRGIDTTATTSAQPPSKWLGSCEQKEDSKNEEVSKTVNEKIIVLSNSSDSDSAVEQNDDRLHVDKTHDQAKHTNIKMEKSRNKKASQESTNSQNKALNSKSNNGTAGYSGNSQTPSSGSRGINTTATASAQTPSKWLFLDHFQSASSDEEDVKPKAMEKEKKKNPFGFAAAVEDLFNPTKDKKFNSTKDKKHSRMPYTYEERRNILKYIVDHDEYSRVKGRDLWMIMERRKICPNRTWQSMKEHFLKKIAYNLEAFNFLSASARMKLKDILF